MYKGRKSESEVAQCQWNRIFCTNLLYLSLPESECEMNLWGFSNWRLSHAWKHCKFPVAPQTCMMWMIEIRSTWYECDNKQSNFIPLFESMNSFEILVFDDSSMIKCHSNANEFIFAKNLFDLHNERRAWFNDIYICIATSDLLAPTDSEVSRSWFL